MGNTFWACARHTHNNTLRCAICDADQLAKLEEKLAAAVAIDGIKQKRIEELESENERLRAERLAFATAHAEQGEELARTKLAYQKQKKQLQAQVAKEKRRRVTSTKINNELHERIEGLEDKTLVEELQAQVVRIITEAKPVYATKKNTSSVRSGHELGGYVKHYTIPTHVITAAKAAINGEVK